MTVNLRSLLLGTAISLCLASGALAQTVLNRGNNADPESLDPHKTSTVAEANILRDMFMGLAMHDA